ncbi:MAG TPA: malto-oligosyltrehalose trehalohydrolase, partial [Candidatus Dormibacteraeota bacterium]
PRARRLDAELPGGRHPLRPQDGGWWSGDEPLAPGTDYRLSIDGGPGLPDPRSPFQPEGVHGPSRSVDHEAHAWDDAGWRGAELSDAVIYELHVGTFTPEGTFDAAAARLGHLVDLGVTAVEIMPVAEFPGERGWGYDGVDLYAPHHAYGGPEGLRRLVDACHAHGLAAVLDVVYNHLGPDGNHLGAYAPYFTDRYRTPWGEAINLDGRQSDAVRAFIVDNALMWLRDYHLDGLRLDAVHAIVDTSAVHILEELATRVAALEAELGRRLWLIAESDLNDPRVVRDPERGGYGLTAQWSDDFHHALHAALTGERTGYYVDFGRLEDVARALGRAFVFDGRYSRFRERRHGRPIGDLGGGRFVVCLQNHDQVGNRAGGERSSALMSTGLLRVGAALVLTAPYVPMLFQGEEWGASTPFLYFTDHVDPTLATAVSQGRRREFAAFGWDESAVPDPQDESSFVRSRLDWDEAGREPHAGLLAWHRDLIALRRRLPALRDPDLSAVCVRVDEEHRWLVMERRGVTVAANLGAGAARIPGGARGWGEVLLASAEAPCRDG